jgi:hypothetical protein
MFERGDPSPSDPHMGHVYGLAMPLLKRGIPVTPVQLENVGISNYLDSFRVLLLTYQGMKPLAPEVHAQLADWVRQGGALVVCDDDSDPFNAVHEWWNSVGRSYRSPREHLFEQLGYDASKAGTGSDAEWRFGQGGVIWLRENPARLASAADGDSRIVAAVKQVANQAKLKWSETDYLTVRRGPYVIAAGLDESISTTPKVLKGRFVNLFDSELRVQKTISIEPGTRFFLRDLDAAREPEPQLLASACKALVTGRDNKSLSLAIEGVARTPAILLIHAPKPPRAIAVDGQPISEFTYSETESLLWVRLANEARPRALSLQF